SGSFIRRRSSTPGVSSSSRVAFPADRCPRTVKPTGPLSSLPSSAAIRRAAARTAIRRGWVTRIRPAPAGASAPARAWWMTSATSGGTKVVLPVPGGAVTTIAPLRAAAVSSCRAAATGSPAPMASRSKRWAGMAPLCRPPVQVLVGCSVDQIEAHLVGIGADAGDRDGPQIDGNALPDGGVLDGARLPGADRGGELGMVVLDPGKFDGQGLPGPLGQLRLRRITARLGQMGALAGAGGGRLELLRCRGDRIGICRHGGRRAAAVVGGPALVRGASLIGGAARIGGLRCLVRGGPGLLLAAAAGGQQGQGQERPGQAGT